MMLSNGRLKLFQRSIYFTQQKCYRTHCIVFVYTTNGETILIFFEPVQKFFFNIFQKAKYFLSKYQTFLFIWFSPEIDCNCGFK